MNYTNDTGGPAFPHECSAITHPGMTLRDYFAAKAMQGMLAASENCPTDKLADYSYQIADAMLKAREA